MLKNLCHLVCRDVPAKKVPKNNISKTSCRESRISTIIEEGHLPTDLRRMENVIQSIDGGKNLPTTDRVNLFPPGSLSSPENSSEFLEPDCCQPEQERVSMEFPDSLFVDIEEPTGLDNTTLKQVKQEEFFDHISPQDDLVDLGPEYEDLMAGFPNFDNMLSHLSANG